MHYLVEVIWAPFAVPEDEQPGIREGVALGEHACFLDRNIAQASSPPIAEEIFSAASDAECVVSDEENAVIPIGVFLHVLNFGMRQPEIYACTERTMEEAMRAKLNLTIERSVAEEARALGVNMSRVAESAIAEVNRVACNRAWVEANRDALEAYSRQIEQEGPALRAWRRF